MRCDWSGGVGVGVGSAPLRQVKYFENFLNSQITHSNQITKQVDDWKNTSLSQDNKKQP
jgi:hypothetical protein